MASKLKTRNVGRLILEVERIESGYKVTYSYGDNINRKYSKDIYEPAAFGKLTAFIHQKLQSLSPE